MFVAVNFVAIMDVLITLPETNRLPASLTLPWQHEQKLSEDVFPPGQGQLPAHFSVISWNSDPRTAINECNYIHALCCTCQGQASCSSIPKELGAGDATDKTPHIGVQLTKISM